MPSWAKSLCEIAGSRIVPFRGVLAKSCGLLLVATFIGAVDDLQVRYVDVAGFGVDAEIVYQTCFMGAAAIGAFAVLRHRQWSRRRNLSNLLMAVPVAAMADNVSIDFGTLRPYLIVIPSQGYEWRRQVFNHVAALSGMAQLVNQQSLAPGILDGYLIAIAMIGAYATLQFSFHRSASRPKVSV